MRRSTSVLTAAAAAAAFLVVPTAQSASAAPKPAPHHKVASRDLLSSSAASLARARTSAVRKAHGHTKSSARLTDAAAHLRPNKDGTVRVAVSGNADQVSAAVRAAGARSFGAYHGQTSVMVAKSKLAALAAAPGVTAVDAAKLGFVTGTSEGVAESGATAWHTAGQNGAGTKIAIIDAGFAGAPAEVTAGHLGANTHITNTDCSDLYGAQHGTAVAEIVQQMAPAAELFLVCVESNLGFGQAVQGILAYNNANPSAKITIATSSLAFPLDSRGDGSGDSTSTANAVQAARRAGVLWIQSAGNYALDHWSGRLTDVDHDELIDMHGGLPGEEFEDDVIEVDDGESATIALQWDQWPTSNAQLSLAAAGEQCEDAECAAFHPINPDGNDDPTPIVVDHVDGTAPTLQIDLPNATGFPQLWDIVIVVNGTFPATRYDLTYFGINTISGNACPGPDINDCQTPPAAYSGSVTAPAFSPFAVAVGAHFWGDSDASSVEPYSSQGPSIDGRIKPDITGYDGTSSFLSDFSTGFFGTSAAAPHVAGAAALVKGQHPTWDASQVQNFLEQRANDGAPDNPPLNSSGYGVLTLGDPATSALPPAGSYSRLATPQRILDTRTTLGGHHARLGAGQSLTLSIPTLPADATAVAINLTGVKANATTFLAAFPGGTAWPNTSNLNLSTTDSTAAVFAIVSVNAARSITIRNDKGTIDVLIDELGYFRTTPVSDGLYAARASALRVLDTRTTLGGHHSKLPSNGTVTVNPAAPAGATAAIVSITSVNSTTKTGFFAAAPTCSTASSTLNFNLFPRANLAVVGLSAGAFCISNSVGAADVVVDVLGYMGTSGAQYVGLPAPKRIVDTRTGNGPVPRKQVPANTSIVLTGSGVGEVPFDASALMAGLVEASATTRGYLDAFAGASRIAEASTLNYSAGRIVPNAAVIGLQSSTFGIYNVAGNTNVVLDLFGYFRPAA